MRVRVRIPMGSATYYNSTSIYSDPASHRPESSIPVAGHTGATGEGPLPPRQHALRQARRLPRCGQPRQGADEAGQRRVVRQAPVVPPKDSDSLRHSLCF